MDTVDRRAVLATGALALAGAATHSASAEAQVGRWDTGSEEEGLDG